MKVRSEPISMADLAADLRAGVAVFLVALPLCLGVALASGVSPLSGLIAGIVGGLLVTWLSGSRLSVSGPAAGLVAVVVAAIETLGSFEAFLLATLFAGVLQVVFGFAKAGGLAAYFPSTVIKGMLAGIGLLLIFKQVPLAVGHVGHSTLVHQFPGEYETFDEWRHVMTGLSPGAVIMAAGSLAIMIAWDRIAAKFRGPLRLFPAPLVAVAWGIGANAVAGKLWPSLAATQDQLVQLPALTFSSSPLDWLGAPDFSQAASPQIYAVAVTLAVVASLETLLNLEAVDRLDPLRRVAPTNRELKAQGIGNIASSLLGGLPLTSVIVRSSANVNAGARSKLSSFVHGLLLLASVISLAPLLNSIPVSTLAAILIFTGYKLVRPALLVEVCKRGVAQWAPFAVTVVGILVSDILKGVAAGVVVSLFFIGRETFSSTMTMTQHGINYLLRFHKDVTFFNKALLRDKLGSILPHGSVVIDGTRARFIDHDIREAIGDFVEAAKGSRIAVEVRGIEAPGALLVAR